MITKTKDGRTILEGRDYTNLRAAVYYKQGGRCLQCGTSTNLKDPIEFDSSFHIAHRGSRGMGGAFRDDVIGLKRGQIKGGLCAQCHRNEHNL